MAPQEGRRKYVSPQERASGMLQSLSHLPAEQTPITAVIAQLHALQPDPDFVPTVLELHRGIQFPKDCTTTIDPAVSTLVEGLLYPRGESHPNDDPRVIGMRETIKKAFEDARYDEMYGRLRNARANVGKFVERWSEIEAAEAAAEPDQVAQAAGHLLSIRHGLVRLTKLDELAEGTARRRTATVWQPRDPLAASTSGNPYDDPRIQESEHLQILGAHEDRALEGLSDHRDPLMADLRDHIAALARVHPNTIADALPHVLTEEEKEEVVANRQDILEVRDLTNSAPEVTTSKDQAFREWAAGIDNVGTRLIMAGEFIHKLHEVKRTIANRGRIRFEGRVDTELLDDITENVALVTVFGKRVLQESKE